MKTYISTLLLCFMLTTSLFSQERFGPDTRLTDIIVKVEPTVLQFSEERDQEVPGQVEIAISELAEYVDDRNVQLILRSFPDADPADTVIVNEFGRSIKLLDRSLVFRFRFPENSELNEIAQELQDIPGIIFAETIPEFKLFTVGPNDQYFASRQWNLHHTGQGFQPPVTSSGRADIRAPEAWEIYTGSQNVNIGIIDTGVILTHDDLADKTTGDPECLFCFNPFHGTHVAGIAAAITDNEKGIAGVDWNAQIISRDLGGASPEEIYDNVISALNAEAHILNNSWGLSSSSELANKAFATAYNMNALSTAAMGNDGDSDTTYYPAGLVNVMAIGASTHENEKSGFSNYGNHIDLVAPGGADAIPPSEEDIYSTFGPDNDDYEYDGGTSMATAHVSGTASLLRGYGQEVLGKTLYNDDITRILQLSADEVSDDLYTYDADGWNIQMGHGRLNAFRALQRLIAPYELKHWSETGGVEYSNSGWSGFFYGLPGAPDGHYVGNKYEIRTTVQFSEDFIYLEGVWGRGAASVGYSPSNQNYTMGYTDIVSFDSSSATLRTFIYNVCKTSGGFCGWYPTTTSNVEFAYSVLGVQPEVGGPNEIVTFFEDFKVKDGNSLTILAGTELNLHGDLIVESGASLEIEEGVTINFKEDDIKILADGELTIIGGLATEDRIVINSNGSNSGNEIIANRMTTIQRADINSVPVTITGNAGFNLPFIERVHFANAPPGAALTIENTSHVAFRRNHIDHLVTSNNGLNMFNVTSIEMTRNTFEGGSRGIWASNTEIEEFYRNVIEKHESQGMRLTSGSHGYLLEEEDDGEEEGRNRIWAVNEEEVTAIYVSSSSTAFLGDTWIYGRNTIRDDDPDELIENLNSSHTVKAQRNYWGRSSGASSSWFAGSVDFSNHMTSDGTGSSGAPIPFKMVDPDGDTSPAREQRKEMLLELISTLEEDAYREKNDHRLTDLYIYMRMDREDKMGLRDDILSTIAEWSSRGSLIASEYNDSPEVRRAVETAMLLEIRLAFRDEDYELASLLNEEFGQYIQLTENRVAHLENRISLYIFDQDYEAALQLVDQGRTLASGESFSKPEDWDEMDAYLNRRLEQAGGESGTQDKLDPEDTQEQEESQPETFALEASYPNPFNPVTQIPFTLPENSQVRLEVYDILGRRVAVLADRMYEAGRHELAWDASRMSSGVYLIRMVVAPDGGQQQLFNRSVTLVK